MHACVRGRLTCVIHVPTRSHTHRTYRYSHVWLVFVFHHNTNKKFRPKVAPPRLGGKTKCGVFATRTPHRFNNLGMSVVRLESVKGRTLHFSGVDLVEGTPVLDIKPYHPGDMMSGQW